MLVVIVVLVVVLVVGVFVCVEGFDVEWVEVVVEFCVFVD